ncbi:MAG: hypothetical protein HQ515_24900 [Phycisphaeraceae bacterium]|nr:hypothetical protein [Phycisphaeraceae bacterium]
MNIEQKHIDCSLSSFNLSQARARKALAGVEQAGIGLMLIAIGLAGQNRMKTCRVGRGSD